MSVLEAPRRIDHLAVACFFPWLPDEPIASFRRTYYPTADIVGPHMTLVFPVAATIETDAFEAFPLLARREGVEPPTF